MSPPTPRPGARRRWLFFVPIPFALAGICWWLTEPLERPDDGSGRVASRPLPISEAADTPRADSDSASVAWPEGKMEGMPAKRLLLNFLERTRRRLDAVEGYTATFRRQERIGGKLGPEQTLRMKARSRPFAIYLKFLAPKAGKEVVYASGKHDNKVIAHSGDWKDKLIPRLRLDPTGAIALADSRHPITDAGLVHLTDKLVGFRRMDLHDAESQTVLDRVRDAEGRDWLRSVHTHPDPKSNRPFARVEVLYDPDTRLPRRIDSFDWLAPGHDGEPLPLAERYIYDDLDLEAPLSDIDFDPANPAYAFSRF